MKNKILLILVFSFFVLSLSAENSVGITLKVKGDVTHTHKEQASKAKDGTELQNNDVLESKENSYAVVKFIDGSSVVKLFPKSILTINAEKKDGVLNKRSKVNLGELWAKVTKNTGDFIVDTPTTVVSVKGTQFVLKVDEQGGTELLTIKGIVNLKNKKDDKEADVGEGQKATTTGEGEIVISMITEGELDGYDVQGTETLQINLQNDAGERRSVEIELEQE